jgi:hypothetical protein
MQSIKLFAAGIWDKLWSRDGLLPPLEFNQGLFSLIALILLFLAFLAATKRANKAEARATQAERDRKRDAEATEAARLQFLEESRAREVAAVERAERDRRASQIRQFVTAANGVIGGVLNTLKADQQRAEADPSVAAPRPTQAAKRQATVAASSLVTILPTAPLNAALITSTRDSALVLEILANAPPVLAEQGDKFTADFIDLLTGAQHTLLHHEQSLLADIGLGQNGAYAAAN